MNRYVVDASLAIKWFLPENYQKVATSYLKQSDALFAPSYLKVEFNSILSKWCRSGRLNYEKAIGIRLVFNQIQIGYIGFETLSNISFDVASKNSVTYYDALYLCTAKLKKCELITFDRKLKESVKGTQFESIVRLIE